jgi:hypothetical protein
MAGIFLELIALCGPGEFSFSNRVCVSSAEWATHWQGESSSVSSSNGRADISFRQKEPTLLLKIDGLKRSQDLLLRLRDEQGRTVAADFRGRGDQYYRYQVKVPKGAGKVDLEAILQKPPRIEYIVEPPRPKPESARQG